MYSRWHGSLRIRRADRRRQLVRLALAAAAALALTAGCDASGRALQSCLATTMLLGPGHMDLRCPPEGLQIKPAAVVSLIELHGPEGQQVFVNVEQITSLRSPLPNDLKQFQRGTACLVVTASGKFVATRETCAEIAKRIMFAPH